MTPPFATPAVLAEELLRYQRPAPDDEFQGCHLARHYQCVPQYAAARLTAIQAECLAAGIDLGPAIETLENRPEPTIGRIQVYLLLEIATQATEALRRFAAYLQVAGKPRDEVVGYLEKLDLHGLVIIQLQLLAAAQAAII